MEKIALFGTSADPPTVGHQAILRWLTQNYDRVVVWASDNPFKQHQTSLEDRSQMLRLLIANLDSSGKNISLHPELSDRYTLVTVNKARKKWGEVEFNLVIGSDILSQITNWYRIDELLQQVKLLIVPRVGYEINDRDLASLSKLGGEFAIAPFDPPQVSSSTYRSQEDSSLISPVVEKYIQQNDLYSSAIDANQPGEEYEN